MASPAAGPNTREPNPLSGCSGRLLPVSGEGRVIRLFDRHRDPPEWAELMGPGDCAVFLKDRSESTALRPDGRPYADLGDCECVVFGSFDAAQRFCEATVRDLPHVRCEIYDREGPLHPPMAVVLHPDFQAKESTSAIWPLSRKLLIGLLVLLALPLFWFGSQGSTSSDLAIFLGINCLLLALRFVYWTAASARGERKRLERLDAHRKLEKRDA